MAMDFYELLKGTVPERFKPWFEWLHDTVSVWIFWLCVAVAALGILLYISRNMWREWSWVKHLWHLLRRKGLPKATTFMVAITHLDGDEKDAIRKQLMDALHDLPFEVSGFDRFPKFEFEVAQKEQLQEQHDQARKWLEESGTDLLIWGKVLPAVAQKERRLRLYFTAKDTDRQSEVLLAESQMQDFPVTAKVPLEAMIRSQVLARLSSFPDAKPIAAELQKEVERIRDMTGKWPQGETRAALHLELGKALLTIGKQVGGKSEFEAAVDAFSVALNVYTRERFPEDWGYIQNYLGIAQEHLGRRETNTEKLEVAVRFFHKALEVRSYERVPLDWATTKINLGNALASLGERESGTQKLNLAVDAIREALDVFTFEHWPIVWAIAQNNLGSVLMMIGERENSFQRLNEAVSTIREALKVSTYADAPLDWAMAQNNLGSGLLRVGEGESNKQMLEEAVMAFREALKAYTRERSPHYWATIQSNLGSALFSLAIYESGTERLEEAVSVCREALQIRTRERVPLEWAETQNNLAGALTILGARKNNAKYLDEAVNALCEALNERTRERLPFYWARSQCNLGIALKTLGIFADSTDQKHIYFLQAITAFKGALDIFHANSITQLAEDTAENLRELQALVNLPSQ